MTQKIKFNFLQKTSPRVNPLGVSVALLGSVVALVSVSQTALAASREWDAGDGFANSTRGKKTQIFPGSILNVIKLFDASSACFYFDKTNRFMRMFSGLKCKVDSEGGVIGVSKVEDPMQRVPVYVNVPGLGLEFVSNQFKVTQIQVTIAKDVSNGSANVFAVRIVRDLKPPTYLDIGTFEAKSGQPNTLATLCDVQVAGKTNPYAKVCTVHGDGKGHLMLVLNYKAYSDAYKK